MRTTIDWDKPLPTHTSVDYWEEYARLVLQHIDPIKYGELRLSDKPDLKDRVRSMGVEVTQAVSQNTREAESCYSKLSQEQDESRRLKLIERIKQCGATVESGFMSGPAGRDDFLLIYEAHHEKLIKLNANSCEPFKRNELFIQSNIFADNHMCLNALSGRHPPRTPCVREQSAMFFELRA